MLIDLCLPLTINPLEYPTTIAIRVETDDRPDCGVFAGRHTDFARDEEGKKVPLVDADESGRQTFLLDREPGPEGSLCRRWHYSAIGWQDAIYVDQFCTYTLTLQEYASSDVDGRETLHWAVSVASSHPLFHLLLPDYEPGALARGVVFQLEARG